MKTLLSILACFLFLMTTGSAPALDLVDLSGDPGRFPFDTQNFSHYQAPILKNGLFGPPGILFDVDGDGFKDWIRSNNDYVCAVGHSQGNPVTYYQTNLPPDFCREENSSFSISPPMDLDGDGRSEIVVTGHTDDHWAWRFWILDPISGAIKGSFDLEGGEEVRQDQRWDGNYIVKGTLEVPGETGSRTALLLCVNIGFDVEGRGVLAVDPWTGEILWRFITGPNPLPFATEVVDLDLDGQLEVVVYGRAPDNLGGREINGYSDDESRLFVLDNRGELQWTRRLGGWFGGGYLVVSDLVGDHHLELVTSTYTTPEVWGEVAVWSHDGTCVARLTGAEQYQDIALFPGREEDGPSLVISTHSGFLKVFNLDQDGLTPVADIKVGTTPFINCVADILPVEGEELVFSTLPGDTWVLGRDLKPLAHFSGEPPGWHSKFTHWEISSGVEILMRESGASIPLQFSRAAPAPVNMALIASMGTLVMIVAGGVVYRKKFAHSYRGDPSVLREVRINLLTDLELSSHGAIAPLKCLRRLIWHMNAMVSGLGNNESIEIRLRETWTESRENALPHLAGILDRTRLAGLDVANIDYAARALDRIGQLLEELAGEDFQISVFDDLAAEINNQTTKADEALQDLRREIAGGFQTDLAVTVSRVMRANSQIIDTYGITVRTGYRAHAAAGGGEDLPKGAVPALNCLIDPQELAFVIDNLVENAARSMKGAPIRNLDVNWSQSDGLVTVDVRDTGCGIPEEHHNRILETNFSTRDGGGKGLPGSRNILRKYGGGLMVLKTTPGQGTTFRLTVPTA